MLDKINLKKIMLKEEYKQEVPPLKQKWGKASTEVQTGEGSRDRPV